MQTEFVSFCWRFISEAQYLCGIEEIVSVGCSGRILQGYEFSVFRSPVRHRIDCILNTRHCHLSHRYYRHRRCDSRLRYSAVGPSYDIGTGHVGKDVDLKCTSHPHTQSQRTKHIPTTSGICGKPSAYLKPKIA